MEVDTFRHKFFAKIVEGDWVSDLLEALEIIEIEKKMYRILIISLCLLIVHNVSPAWPDHYIIQMHI